MPAAIHSQQPRPQEASSEPRKPVEYALLALGLGALLGLVLILLFALSTSSPFSVLGNAMMLAGGSALTGGFVGLIFGIPRALRQSEGEGSQPSNEEAERKPAGYTANTNLEQISDWLTKILVGAGLTQLGSVGTWLREIGAASAPALGGGETGKVFASVTVLAYVLTGFLVGFLWARLYLGGALRQADLDALDQKFVRLRDQVELDARARTLALRQLNPTPVGTAPDVEELRAAIRDASPDVREEIYQRAAAFRWETWQDQPISKEKMERVIPVFQALAESMKEDAEKQRLVHFQLTAALCGIAMAGCDPGEWRAAKAEVETAIQVRGPSTDPTWLQLELMRARCRIELDGNYRQNKPSQKHVRDEILADLRACGNVEAYVGESINEPIKRWLELNAIPISQLSAAA